MSVKQKQLFEFLQPLVQALGFELYWVEYGIYAGKINIRVFVDKNGLTSTDCANISRYIKAELVVANILGDDNYQLEVSSPGLDRSLFTLEHFKKAVGSDVDIKVRTAVDGKCNFNGKILDIDGDMILLSINFNETVKINFDNVQRANIKIDIKTLFKKKSDDK